MALSGIAVDDEVGKIFGLIKNKKEYKWAIFKIENKKKVVVDVVAASKDEEFKEFFQKLQAIDPIEPRFCIYDVRASKDDGRKVEKVAFIHWSPDEASMGSKMIYASTKDTVKKGFDGIGASLQICDLGDFEQEMIEVIVKSVR